MRRSDTIELSLVVPALKEAALIGSSLDTIADYLKQHSLLKTTELIVVAADGGDDTATIAKDHGKQFPHFQLLEPGPKAGKGRDVRIGVQAAHGSYIFFTDADLATPIDYLKPAFEVLKTEGVDVVIGTRNLWKIHKGLKRKCMSVLANWLVRLLLLRQIPDSQCGFKGFTAQAAEELFSKTTINGWAFDMEILAIAEIHELQIKNFQIDRWSDPKLEEGLVGESPLQASINTFKELWRIRKQRSRGQYL